MHRRVAIPLAALTLAVAGLLAWFLLVVPLLNTTDLRWYASHSMEEICAEMERVVAIWGWSHDVSLSVGQCGPEWVGYILESVGEGESLDTKDVHLGSALQLLTNQDLPADDRNAWDRWWQQHRSESQREWWISGFSPHGIEVSDPLTGGDARRLLALIGEKEVPFSPLRYNAFRLIRQEEVVWSLVRGESSQQAYSAEEARGLFRFALWNSATEPPAVDMKFEHVVVPTSLGLLALVAAVFLGRGLAQR